MRLGLIVVFLAFLLTFPLFAQNELGIFANHASFKSSTIEPSSGLVPTDTTFDAKVGYGISFNHFFSPDMSIQLSGQSLRSDAMQMVTVGGVTAPYVWGTFDVKQYAAVLQYYLNPRGTIVPYVGGGLAWMRSGKLNVAPGAGGGIPAGTIHMNDDKTWTVDAGVDFRLSRSMALSLAGSYTRYTLKNDTPTSPFQNLKVDPVTVSAGLKMRF